jgi:hypothetical protein
VRAFCVCVCCLRAREQTKKSAGYSPLTEGGGGVMQVSHPFSETQTSCRLLLFRREGVAQMRVPQPPPERDNPPPPCNTFREHLLGIHLSARGGCHIRGTPETQVGCRLLFRDGVASMLVVFLAAPPVPATTRLLPAAPADATDATAADAAYPPVFAACIRQLRQYSHFWTSKASKLSTVFLAGTAGGLTGSEYMSALDCGRLPPLACLQLHALACLVCRH